MERTLFATCNNSKPHRSVPSNSKPGIIIQRSDHLFQEGISEVKEEATGSIAKNEAGVDITVAEASRPFGTGS
jgi:hypothetical protein